MLTIAILLQCRTTRVLHPRRLLKSFYPDSSLGEHIKKWRLEEEVFQGDLAKMIGVDEMTIVNWEKGRTKPTKKNMEKIKAIRDLNRHRADYDPKV